MQKHVNLVVLVKSFLSNEYLLAKFGFDTAVNRSVSNVTIVNFLFVPLRYLQFLKIVRSTAAAATEDERFKVR